MEKLVVYVKNEEEAVLAEAVTQAAKTQAIKDCVIWLVENHSNYQPNALAEYMASDMLGGDKS